MKFCIIGWCGHTHYIADGLKKLPDFELVGIASGEEAKSGQYILDRCKAMEITRNPKLYDNWITMLDELKPDVISADGPYHLHGIECLEAVNTPPIFGGLLLGRRASSYYDDKNIISRIRTRLICFFDRIAFLSDFYGMTVK